MKKPNFTNLEEEIKWWKTEEGKKFHQRQIEKDKERKLKSEMTNFENWRLSGSRTH